MGDKKPALILFSQSGLETARQIKKALPNIEIHAFKDRADGDVYFENAADHIATLFEQGRPLIGLCATGIMIRLIARHLDDKRRDPPVLSIAEDGSAIVPLLGGHHGANDLAQKLADTLGIKAAITTSSEVHFNAALDSPPAGYHLANPEHYKDFIAAVLSGKSIQLNGSADFLIESALPFTTEKSDLQISVTTKRIDGSGNHLVYHPKTLVLGTGSERGADASEGLDLALEVLKQSDCAPESIAAVASIDLKADEAALHAVAEHFDVPLWLYDAATLKEVEDQLPNPSDIVKSEIGVAGVAEATAIVATGGSLIVPKTKSKRVTAALGFALNIKALRPGRERGSVFLIGVGPGDAKWRSREATDYLSHTTDWVGYGLYLDLIQDLKRNQKEHRFDLGEEEKRVRHALELAAEGRKVAVICSGDPGIYAMATLAYELIDSGAAGGPISDNAKRVEVITCPGISAFQAAAAKAGAPIGHDFCCISLSDLLTPREDILRRIKAAAEGDFVTAFYNPRSKRRITLLDEAFAALRQHRPADTPVILATDLGRPNESVTTFTLKTVKSEDVDMLTLVIVGSSQSKVVQTGDGKKWVYTPRGYDRKDV